jgi:hypothetical protein
MNLFTAINTVLASTVQVIVTACSAINRVVTSVDHLAHVGEIEAKIVLNDSLIESEEKLALGNARIEKIRADIAAKATQQSEE